MKVLTALNNNEEIVVPASTGDYMVSVRTRRAVEAFQVSDMRTTRTEVYKQVEESLRKAFGGILNKSNKYGIDELAVKTTTDILRAAAFFNVGDILEIKGGKIIKKKNETRPSFCTDAHLKFLDSLRETGSVNMFAALVPLMNAFDITRHEGRAILTYWMKSFSKRHR